MSRASTLDAATETYNQIQPLAAHSTTGAGVRLQIAVRDCETLVGTCYPMAFVTSSRLRERSRVLRAGEGLLDRYDRQQFLGGAITLSRPLPRPTSPEGRGYNEI